MTAQLSVTHEVLALFQDFFNAHIQRDDQDHEPPPKKIKPTAITAITAITPDDAVRLFASSSNYYVKIHLEGDIFNMNGSSTNFAKRENGPQAQVWRRLGHRHHSQLGNAIDAQ
jgi:hypothetical protein